MNTHQPEGEFSGHPIAPSVKAAIRRFALLGRGLAIPATPQPWEGLPDLFLRAIHRNGDEFTACPWRNAFHRSKLYFSHRNYVDLDIDDQLFSDFLGTPVGASDISRLRYTRQGKGMVSFFGATILLTQLAQHRRVSPRFLAANGYQKAVWSLLSLTFDPSNREHLIDRCPNPDCAAQLTFNRTLGICFCHACADPNDPLRGLTDLRDFPQPIVELDNFENVKFACSLVDPELDSKRDLTRLFHPDLRSLGKGEVFEFILLMARLLDQELGKPYCYAVSPKGLDEAAAAVRNWPGKVIEIAERVQTYWRYPTQTMGRGYKHPVSSEVYAFRSLFGMDFFHRLRDQLRSGLPARTVRPEPADTRVARFRRPHPRTTKEGGFNLQDQGDKLLYASLLARGSRAVRADFKASGLPFLELVKLYSENYVNCPDPGLSQLLVNGSSKLPNLVTRLVEGASPPRRGLMSLYRAITAISDGKIAWSRVIENIMDGKLEVIVQDGAGPLIRRLQIVDTTLLEGIIAQPENDSWADDVVLTNNEAGFYIGLTENEVSTLVTGGLMPANGLKLSTVKHFRQQYICGAEIMSYLAVCGHPNRSMAATFSTILKAGIEPLHSRPSVRDRETMRSYFRSLGY